MQKESNIPMQRNAQFQIYKSLIDTFNKIDENFISYIPLKNHVYKYHIICCEPYCNLINESPFLQINWQGRIHGKLERMIIDQFDGERTTFDFKI
ncbi:hypothetical protein HZS_3960 [Henneguya salminicola]|nr:hypothetical protein HZS_3960 [Henneguya salminicola]